MLVLLPTDPTVILSAEQMTKIRFCLLELLPATRCDISAGPGVKIVVRNRSAEDLAPGVRARNEEIIGCPVVVE